MCAPKAPKPADPVATASAQTSTNIGSAIANRQLNNMNQITPDGSLSYSQSGTYDYTDPLNGKVHAIPQYTATQTLSPAQQAIKDQNDAASLNMASLGADQSSRIGGLLGRPMDTNSLPKSGDANSIRNANLKRVGSGPALVTHLRNNGPIQRQIGDGGDITKSYGTDFSSDRQRVEDALMKRMNPQLDQDRGRLESRLASQGIRLGSEAYSSAMDDHGRQSNDARLGAIWSAGQEQSRLTGLEAQRAGFENSAQAQTHNQNSSNAQFANNAQAQAFQQEASRAGFMNDSRQQMHQNQSQGISMDNQAAVQETNTDIARFDAANNSRNQALQEQFNIRNQPINEITALMSGGQVSNPNFTSTPTTQLATTDFAGIQANYDNQMQANHQANSAQKGQLFGGLLGFGSNLLMASDRRVKENIKKVGKTDDGQQIYSYRYKSGGPIQMGLMAQDVEKKRPDAVTEVGGIKMVNYGKALA